MLRRLQSFTFRDSPYERPNQEWVCGHAADGAACSLGPDGNGQCHTVAECSPRFDAADRRYRCGRAPQHGGACDEGPGPDGSCCHTITKCQPTRSLTARRRMTVRWVLVISIGLLLLGASGEFGARFVLSGDLTFEHGDVADCGGCHGMEKHGPIEWLVGAMQPESGLGDSERCLECHRLGEGALLAHSLPKGRLSRDDELGDERDPPLLLSMARLAGPPPAADQPLACSRCHQEHNGRHFNLTAMSNQRCQACHADQFASFADGHPTFEGYPYRRRPRIAFHHASHIGKHFKKNTEISAPTSCTGCHEPDSSGRAMLVKPFDQSCSACHLSQIQGEGRAGDKGYAMLGLPGFDVQTPGIMNMGKE